MSNIVLGDVWKMNLGDPTRKLIAVCLADAANHERICWPSLGRIAEICEVHIDTVRRHIRDLESTGLLTREDHFVKGRQTSNRYIFADATLAPALPLHPCDPPPCTGATPDPCTHATPILEPKEEPPLNHKPAKAKSSILELLVAAKRTPLEPPTSRKVKLPTTSIPPDLEAVRDFYTEQGWHDPAALAAEFHDHHTASGWKLKTGPMRDWEAAARTWMRNARKWAKPWEIPAQIAYFDNGLPDAAPEIQNKLRAMISESAQEGDADAQFLVESGYGSRN